MEQPVSGESQPLTAGDIDTRSAVSALDDETALAIPHAEGTPGTYEALVEGTDLDELVTPCPDIPGLTVLPATIDLAGAEIELVSLVARETRLDKALQAYLKDCEAAGDR